MPASRPRPRAGGVPLRVIPFRPEPERRLRIEVPPSDQTVVVVLELYGRSSGIEPGLAGVVAVIRDESGREVVATLQMEGDPLPIHLLGRVVGPMAAGP